MEFHEKLQQLRRQNNMTQEQLALAVGVSRTTVTMWEAGESMPTSNKLPKLAQVLGCTIDELFRA